MDKQTADQDIAVSAPQRRSTIATTNTIIYDEPIGGNDYSINDSSNSLRKSNKIHTNYYLPPAQPTYPSVTDPTPNYTSTYQERSLINN